MAARTRRLGTSFPADQPPSPDPSLLAPYLRANQNQFSGLAFEIVHVTNIAVCLLTALALIAGYTSPPTKR